MKALDQIDTKILNILQDEGGITNVELARRVGLAPATTLDRVRKLEGEGIIRKYVALIDPSKVDRGTTALVAISLVSHAKDVVVAFRDQVRQLPQVLECYHVTGENDYMLKVVVEDIDTYESFLLDQLTQIPGIGKIRTSFVLSTVKHETKIALEEDSEKTEE